MPGAPLFHGAETSASPAGVGGANRIHASAAKTPNDLHFFVWVAVIGILLPALIIGGLKVGGFQFVFKHR